MEFLALRRQITENLFTSLDTAKYFPGESVLGIKVQLSRFCKRGLITRIKRGLYAFDTNLIDELALTSYLYQPSYISLESALAYYGLIPDVPQSVTAITTTTTKTILTSLGAYHYARIEPRLYFGYLVTTSTKASQPLTIAEKEKALLDYFYIRRVNNPDVLRLNLTKIDFTKYRGFSRRYPAWVERIL